MEGVIHYELLERNMAVTAESYCRQLEEEIQQKRPVDDMESFFSMTTPDHTPTANMTKGAIQELDWEILPHPPYSSYLAPSDYHLFRSLSNNLRRVSFNDAELQNWIDEFFTAKPVLSSSVGSKTCPNVGRQS
jgi:hypothetical protein